MNNSIGFAKDDVVLLSDGQIFKVVDIMEKNPIKSDCLMVQFIDHCHCSCLDIDNLDISQNLGQSPSVTLMFAIGHGIHLRLPPKLTGIDY